MRLRRSRLVSEASAGCVVVFCRAIRYLPAAPHRSGGGADVGLAHAVELGHVVDHHRAFVAVLDHAVAEVGGQLGQLGVDVLDLLLVGVAQLGAGSHEVGVVALDQTLRLGVHALRIAFVMDRLDALPELLVEVDGVAVRGHLRRDFLLDFLQGIGLVRRRQVIEDAGDATQQGAALLHRDQGVVEGRRLGVVGDCLDFLLMLGHAALERRQVVAFLVLVELRRAVLQRTRLEERVLALGLGGGRGRVGAAVIRGFRGGGGFIAAAGGQGQAGGNGQRKVTNRHGKLQNSRTCR